ncbi:ABC transporter ATP-binding protein [Cohnella thailandensis]|uniref:ABC transporter ATP-binding protein n=1 Tax=Cohnella thailandensis TaxID=557557 RepID=A0A841SR21_9BACL|nr:ABC transporter ATP-binding protein [Cohnella thailandensis]MBB6633056.1 ABC transporter ATP-binding protein [Cohnella thailandensis]MBP1975249.1 ABC-2 type transport system ATP-binding protein [Cohnella thailandensis]
MALLTVDRLTKRFEGTLAVDGISFAIGEGRCVALLGPNGAGKTTTIRMLTGLLQPSSGAIRLEGMKPGQDLRAWIGYLPQTPAFYGWMTGREFLVYAGRLCGLSAKEAYARSDELLARVGIGAAGKRRISGYSGGMKQRLGLAQALIHRPKLLILDEPVSALDPIGRREVMTLLGELKSETTVLFSTHVLHDAEELCDDVLIMSAGRLAEGGSLSGIREANRQPMMSLETEGDSRSKEWLEGWLKRLPAGFEAASATPAGARLIVRDLETARRTVIRELADADVRVTKLEVGYTTLEDLFLKAVAHS